MAMLCAELIGREREIRTLMTAFDFAGCRRRGEIRWATKPADALTRILASRDERPLAVEEALAMAVASDELVIDEVGCT